MAELTRLELATFRVTGGRSNQTELQLLKLAPRAGFEPATQRLTVVCSTPELPRNHIFEISIYVRPTPFNLMGCARRSYKVAETGGRYWTRTSDPQFVRLMLYQLS
jgi:hypothetical protein